MHPVQEVMEPSTKHLWLLMVLSASYVRHGATNQAVLMAFQLVKDSLADCHVVLLVTTPNSPFLSFMNK